MLNLQRAPLGAVLLSFWLAPAWADQLITQDGQHVEGAVTRQEDGVLSVQTASGEQRLKPLQVLVQLGDAGVDLPAADLAEDGALQDESRGRLEAGFRGYGHALALALQAAAAAPEAVELASARAEVYLRRLEFFGQQTGRYQDLSALCAQAEGQQALTPYARGVAKTLRASCLRALGKLDEAAQLERELGVITQFYLAGVFDNERGTGFASAFPPEQQPFDPAAQWPGKQFPVVWRVQPLESPPGGVIDLDQLCRPNDQALAYLLCHLEVKQATPVALHLGCDDGWTLWLNRKQVAARDLQRPYRPDQDHVGVVLQPGVNELLLKLTAQTGPWRVRLRVTDPAGAPAEGVQVFSQGAVDSLPEGELQRADVAAGALPLLASRAQARADDWRARFHLGYLHFAYQTHDRSEHPDREALEASCKLNPKAAFLRVFLAFALEGNAQYSVNRDGNPRREALEEALRLDPEAIEARLLLAQQYAKEMGNADHARELLHEVLQRSPQNVNATLELAKLERPLGLAPVADVQVQRLEKTVREAVSKGERLALPEDLLEALRSEADSRGDVARQQQLLEERLTAYPGDGGAWHQMALLHWEAGRGQEAEAALRRVVALDPWDTSELSRLADLLEARGDLDGAAQALDGALNLAPDDAKLTAARGKLALEQGDEAQADALFDHALELDPNDVTLRKYVDFRQRHAEKEAPFEERWTIDAAPLVEAAKSKELDPRLTHRVLLRQNVAKVYKDGRTSQFVQVVLRVENEVGARQLASYAARYESDQRLEFQLGRIYRADGRKEEVPVTTFRERRGGEFTRALQGFVRFPPLEPGDSIEVRYRIDDLQAGFFGDYYGEDTYFQAEQPLDWVRYVLIGPKDRTFHFNTPGFKALGGTEDKVEGDDWVAYVFEAKDVPKVESEPNEPWSKERLAQVQVSTFADWNAFARWYWGLVRSQQEADPAIKAKVEELCAGAKTPLEKIRRIYDYVVTDIRYNASWEFGVHGFKPYNATRIYARKFGDCKDKATLINTMLSVVGISSHPVLIFGETERGKEDLTLPLMNHFNHCISWVDFGKDGMFLDGTAEHHPFGTLPTMDYGAKVVVITPEAAMLKQIPYRSPEANSVTEHHVVKVKSDGSAVLESEIGGKGDFEVVLRSWLATAGKRKEVIEPRVGQIFNGAHVTKVECSDLSDLEQPVKLKIEVALPKVTQSTSSGQSELKEIKSWLFDLIYLHGQRWSNLAADAERKEDVILPVPSQLDETVIYELPPGMKIESVPPPAEVQDDFGTYRRVYQVKDGKLEVQRVLEMKTHRIPAAEYQKFRGFVGKIERSEDERPVLGKAEAAE